MAVWMSFEPNPRLYTMYSLWSAFGSPPSNRTGCNLEAGSYYYPVIAGDSNGDFHLLRMNASTSIFYSKYSGGIWSANQTLGTGWLPVIHVDQNDKIHAAWWNPGAPPAYESKESSGTTWSAAENVFSSTICSDLSLITDGNNLPRLACAANGSVYESSRQPDGWIESTIVQSMAGQPDFVKDANNNLHLVWSDSRSGSWDTFYSPTYTCEGILPASPAGLAVLNEIQYTPFLNYCKNLVEEVIYVPAPNGQNDPNEAFQEWADLANSAQYEVAFTVMFWDKFDDSTPPGEEVLAGIQQLYGDIKDPEKQNKYPHGMKVRILLGVQFKTVSSVPLADQRFNVLEQMQNLDIPIYEILPNGKTWKVEVALYEFGGGHGVSNSVHSHVKLMVVDNNKMIVSGYHPQYDFQTEGNEANLHDLGIKISGPIAANGMAVFDSLWEGSEIVCTEEDTLEFDTMDLGDCENKTAENPTHWFFVPSGNDIALPLYRDHYVKAADTAIKKAIESSTSEVFVFQNRVGVPPVISGYPGSHVPTYEENGLLEYADALLEVAPTSNIRILISRDPANIFYNSPSMLNFYIRYYLAGGEQIYGDVVRYYAPNGVFEGSPGLHAKSFMIDENFLVIGSQNFDHSAFGNNSDDLDLVEYSVAIENENIVSSVNSYFDEAWNNSGKFHLIKQNESPNDILPLAESGDVVVFEPGDYEITSTLNVPEGLSLKD